MGFNYKKYLIIRAIWVVASLVLLILISLFILRVESYPIFAVKRANLLVLKTLKLCQEFLVVVCIVALSFHRFFSFVSLVRLFRRNRYYLQQLYWALGLLVFFILLLVFFVFFKIIG